jgi:hypothetical protein
VTAPADAAPLPLQLAGLGELKALLEAKNWAALGRTLDMPSLWAFDRPLPVAESMRLLAELFAGAQELKLLVTAVRRREMRGGEHRSSFACCLMWGEAGSWTEHEVELELHLGSRALAGGGWHVSYLGVTPAARQTAVAADHAETSSRRPAAAGPSRERLLVYVPVLPGVAGGAALAAGAASAPGCGSQAASMPSPPRIGR